MIHFSCNKLIKFIWKNDKWTKRFSHFLRTNRDFGTLGIGLTKIGLPIQTSRFRNRLYAKFGKFRCIISQKNHMACFLGRPVYFTLICTVLLMDKWLARHWGGCKKMERYLRICAYFVHIWTNLQRVLYRKSTSALKFIVKGGYFGLYL